MTTSRAGHQSDRVRRGGGGESSRGLHGPQEAFRSEDMTQGCRVNHSAKGGPQPDPKGPARPEMDQGKTSGPKRVKKRWPRGSLAVPSAAPEVSRDWTVVCPSSTQRPTETPGVARVHMPLRSHLCPQPRPRPPWHRLGERETEEAEL